MNAPLLFGVLFLLLFMGVPVIYCILGSSAVFVLVTGIKPMVYVVQQTFVGMDSFVLLAVPLFTLSGYLMEVGGLSQRLVDWVESVFGRVRGYTGVVTLICCAIFAALTGSGPATVAAISAVMLPALIKNGYPKNTCAGMLAAGGALGPIIPPSIMMIVYGSTMNLSIPDMFVGAIIPGLLILGLYLLVNAILVKKHNIPKGTIPFSLGNVLRTTLKALPVLFLPILILGGIYGGIFTPTEAATAAVVYSLILCVAYRSITVGSFINALKKTAVTSSSVALLVGVAGSFAKLLATAKIPTMLASVLLPLFKSKTVYILLVVLLLTFIGCIMETLSTVVILGPLLVPIGVELGLDPLHLGVVFCVTLVVGFITPPFGLNLFTASSVTDTPFSEVVKGALPFTLVAVIACFIVALVPGSVTLLPSMMTG